MEAAAGAPEGGPGGPARPGRRPRALVALVLAAATVAVYAQVRRHEFVNYDDYSLITRNAEVAGGLSWVAAARAFRQTAWGNWIPLTELSLQANVSAHGLEAGGFLLTNLALHVASTVLLLVFLVRTTGALGAGAFVAGVFALHPLHVESVAWASERKDVLSGLFWMLALLAWARYAERPGAARYVAVALATAAALLSKAVAVTLPFVLLLLDFWPLRRGGARRLVLEKLPLLALAAVAGAVTYLAQSGEGATALHESVPLPLRLANAVDSYAVYLVKAFWPTGLAYFYPHPLGRLSLTRLLVDLALLLAVTGVALAQARRRPFLLVGWLWFLGTLVPMIGLVQVGIQARADRYTYLPLIGLAIAVAYTARDLCAGRRRARRVLGGVGVAALVALAVAAHAQVGVWKDSLTLRRHAVEATGSAMAHMGLANVLADMGRGEEALPHYAEAARLSPTWTKPRFRRANELAKLGRLEESIADYRAVLEREPEHARARANLGFALARAGRLPEARAELERAAAAPRPDEASEAEWAQVHRALGRVRAATGAP